MPDPQLFLYKRRTNTNPIYGVENDNRRVNAKSLLGVLSLGITKGLNITIVADGSDEEEAVAELSELISSNFASSGF